MPISTNRKTRKNLGEILKDIMIKTSRKKGLHKSILRPLKMNR